MRAEYWSPRAASFEERKKCAGPGAFMPLARVWNKTLYSRGCGKGVTHAHRYGIRHYCGALPRDASFRAGTRRSTFAPEAQTPPDQSNAVIRSIQIVDVKDLKPAVRSKVNDIISHTSGEEMQSLRKSIDDPDVVAALKAKGLNSSHVVADGVLTMFTKKA
jgi:hypothetical protein